MVPLERWFCLVEGTHATFATLGIIEIPALHLDMQILHIHHAEHASGDGNTCNILYTYNFIYICST